MAKTAKINVTAHLYPKKKNSKFTQVSIVSFLVICIVKRLFFRLCVETLRQQPDERGDAEGIRGHRL